jgi:hypothetical protein
MSVVVFADSYDHYASLALKGYSALSGFAGITAGGRHGDGITGIGPAVTWVLPSARATLAVGRACKISGLSGNPYIGFQDGNTNDMATLGPYGDGRLVVDAGSFGPASGPSSVVLHVGQWYFLEFSADVVLTDIGPPAKYRMDYSARVNEEAALSGSITNLQYISSTFTKVRVLHTHDDFWITDGEFLGDCHVDPLFADADGTYSDFTPSTPGAHYVLIDENPPDVADYLEATVIGQNESHNYEASDDDQTKGAQLCLYVVPGALTKFKSLARSGGVDVLGAEKTAASVYGLQAYRLSPFTGLDWTKAEVSAMEFGAQATG